MNKKIILSGIMGGVVLIVWLFIFNGVFGFKSSIDMNTITNKHEVYQLLTESITEPGRYIFNPEVAEEMFPANEPVFSVLYGGVGHGAAGSLMILGLIVYLLTPIIGAWMLSQTNEKVLTSYSRKLLFFVAVGVLIALFTDLMNYGIGNYTLLDSLKLAVHTVFMWTLVGLVVAWRMKPVES